MVFSDQMDATKLQRLIPAQTLQMQRFGQYPVPLTIPTEAVGATHTTGSRRTPSSLITSLAFSASNDSPTRSSVTSFEESSCDSDLDDEGEDSTQPFSDVNNPGGRSTQNELSNGLRGLNREIRGDIEEEGLSATNLFPVHGFNSGYEKKHISSLVNPNDAQRQGRLWNYELGKGNDHLGYPQSNISALRFSLRSLLSRAASPLIQYPTTPRKRGYKDESIELLSRYGNDDYHRHSMNQSVTTVGQFTSSQNSCGGSSIQHCGNSNGTRVSWPWSDVGVNNSRDLHNRGTDGQNAVGGHTRSGGETAHNVVWLSLVRRSWARKNAARSSNRLVAVHVPSHTTSRNTSHESRGRSLRKEAKFDDQDFALHLRAGHHRLVGNWLLRAFSAYQLKRIQLRQMDAWSVTKLQNSDSVTLELLANGTSHQNDLESISSFEEAALLQLYKEPATGKGKYTWVDRARLMAAAKELEQIRHVRGDSSSHSSPSFAKTLRYQQENGETSSFDVFSDGPADSIPVIQFVHELSARRILCAAAITLTFAAFTALLWIFLSTSETDGAWNLTRSKRQNGRARIGIVVAASVLLLEAIAFGACVWLV